MTKQRDLRALSPEELDRLVAFFSLLIEMDQEAKAREQEEIASMNTKAASEISSTNQLP